MMRILAAVAAVLMLSACERPDQVPNTSNEQSAGIPAIAPVLTGADAVDSATYARPLEARVHHVARHFVDQLLQAVSQCQSGTQA